MIKELEKVQNMLGIIHDYDTTIAYLRHQKRKRSIKTIIEKIVNIRQDKYEQFGTILQKGNVQIPMTVRYFSRKCQHVNEHNMIINHVRLYI